MPDNSESRKPFEFNKLIELAYLIVVLCAFSWAKEFLLPIVLAIVISFLLAPVVSRLECWGLHSVLAVLSVVAAAFAVIAVLCATLSVEALDMASSLPKYRDNINAKWVAIQQGPPGPLNLAFRNIGELVNDLGKGTTTTSGAQQPAPTKVEIVSGTAGVVAVVRDSMTPLLGPVADFAVVVVLVVFILLERERLRGRFLRLIGHSHMATTTLAVDEAGSRLSSFLLMQLVVNSAYALVIGIGLSMIGIPNALLWAVLTLLLRFLPYVGLWISAFFPLALSIAISTTWTQPILTLLLYIVLEVFTNNVVEPVVLGGSTGISPLAVIVSALFWTWIWGPIGLLLATPITACLVVLGRYFPAFHPYSVMLAADPPTSTETKLLRLFAENRLPEAKALLEELAGMQLSIKTAEELIVPTVRVIEKDLFPGATVSQTRSRIYGQMREVIEELAVPTASNSEERSQQPGPQDPVLVIVPFIREGDEIVGRVLERLLEAEGIHSNLLSWRTLHAEKIRCLKELEARCIVLSATDPSSAAAVGKMARAIHTSLPDAVIFVGLWSLPPSGASRLVKRIRESVPGNVYTNLDQAVRGIASQVSSAAESTPLENEKPSTDESKKMGEPKTYGEGFIKSESDTGILEQVPSRPDERLSENLPDTQKH
jgi:predicted PurR-regulated permease PerM